VDFDGYEIHHGRSTRSAPNAVVTEVLHNREGSALGWQQGSVMGLYVHGLFESPQVQRALFGSSGRSLNEVFDGLADFIEGHFQPGALMRLLDPLSP
jgi:adenosylcobyric acid synthase